ncbi:MAG: folate family ECF transporter S component [Firmicutes bacterium]|nr:folate family ECF transporter S component [Bacillota bacterium]
MKNNKLQIMVKCAFLAAISIILTRFLVIMPTPALRISLGAIPIALAGLMYGPVYGGLVGLVADLIGVIINSQGTPHLGFTISSMLTGVIPGLVQMLYMKRDENKLIASSIMSSLLVNVIIHIGLNTLWLSQLMGKSVAALIMPRAIKALPEIIITIILLPMLYKLLMKFEPKKETATQIN